MLRNVIYKFEKDILEKIDILEKKIEVEDSISKINSYKKEIECLKLERKTKREEVQIKQIQEFVDSKNWLLYNDRTTNSNSFSWKTKILIPRKFEKDYISGWMLHFNLITIKTDSYGKAESIICEDNKCQRLENILINLDCISSSKNCKEKISEFTKQLNERIFNLENGLVQEGIDFKIENKYNGAREISYIGD